MNSFAFLKFSEHLCDASRPRVLWLPHLGDFATKMADKLFEALMLAFYDSPLHVLELACIGKKWAELNEWISTQELYLIADNHNAIDPDALGASTADQRAATKIFVSSFYDCIMLHKVIY